MRYTIPKSGRDALADLMNSPAGFLEMVIEALSKAPPALRRGQLVEHILKGADQETPLSRRSLEEIMGMVLDVYGLRDRDEVSASEIAREVADSARDSGDERLQNPPEGWDNFEHKLAELFSLDNVLGISAKAIALSLSTPRHMHSARILTDARPIYGSDPAEGPSSFVVTHTLQISFHEDDSNSDWYLSVDTDDLQLLARIADRALTKEKSLKTMLSSLQVPVLTYQDVDDAE